MSDFAQSTRALYYPFVNFRSLDWLKSALLYWEGVRRIVPFSDFDPKDGPEVRELVAEGLIESITPGAYTKMAAENFLLRLKPLLDVRGGVFRGTARHNAEILQEPNTNAVIYREKLDEHLIDLLVESGLAHQWQEALGIRKDVAGLYMTTLSAEVAAHQNLVMAADDICCDVSSLYFNTPDGSLTATDDGYSLARLNTSFPKPDSLHNVTLDTILDIRKRYGNERREFRKQMQIMAAKLEKMPSPQAVKDLVEDQRKDVTRALEGLKQSIDETRTNWVWDMLTISVPSGIPAILVAAGAPPVSVMILSGTVAAIGLVNWFGKRRGETRDLRNNPWHYLISLTGATDPGQTVRNFEDGMRALVYD